MSNKPTKKDNTAIIFNRPTDEERKVQRAKEMVRRAKKDWNKYGKGWR